jgi:hypothetical protein
MFPVEASIAALNAQSEDLQSQFDAADSARTRAGLVHSVGSARGKVSAIRKKGGKGLGDAKRSVQDAIKALREFDEQAARSQRFAGINVQVKGLDQLRNFKAAIQDVRSEVAGKLNDAVDKFRTNWESTTGKAIDAANAATLKGFDQTTDAIVAQTAAAQELARLRGVDDTAARAKEDADNAKALADAQFLVAHSGGKVHADALVQLADVQAQIDATARKRQEDVLEAQVASETAAIQDQRAQQRAALEDQMAADRQARMDADVAGFYDAESAKLSVLTSSLEAQRLSYRQYVDAVNAELARIGVAGIEGSPEGEASITGGSIVRRPAAKPKKRPPKKHAAGGWTGLVLNELGPERVYANRAGGVMVQQASEVQRGGGGGGIVQNFYGPINSARSARIMGNQLAHRLRFG